MKRLFLLVAALLLVAGAPAGAQEKFPSKPVRIVVAFAPGSATDIFARLLAEHLRAAWNQPVVIENKVGAFGIVAIEEMARSRPDGHTLMIGNISTSVLTPLLYAKKFSINYDRDVVAVSRVGFLPNFFAVTTKDMPVKTLAEFVAYAKERPGKLRYASSGVASFPHYDSEILARRAGIQMEHIPVKEGPPVILRDMATGDVHASFLNVATSVPMVKAGQVRPLAVTTDERLADYPDVPTFKEAGFPGVGTSLWAMMFAPAATPKPILEEINAATTRALSSEALKEAYRKVNITPTPSPSLAAAQEWLAGEIAKWKAVTDEVKVEIE